MINTILKYFVICSLILEIIFGQNKFKSVPTTVKTSENDTVILPCYISDEKSVMSVDWYKDNLLIASSSYKNFSMVLSNDNTRIVLWNNGSLQVNNLRDTDTGKYECHITRSDKIQMAQVHYIEVIFPPVVYKYPQSDEIKVNLYEQVQLICNATGVPDPIVVWYKNSQEIKMKSDMKKLVFNATNQSFAGLYECRAENGVGKPVVKQFRVIIFHPPELTTTKQWIHTAPGLRIILDCSVIANPPARLFWLKNGEFIRHDNRVISTLTQPNVYSLLIRHIRLSDFGNYTCKAKNELGVSSLEFQITGAPNPAVFKNHQNSSIPTSTSNNFTLIWEVDSYSPIIEYNLWFREYSKKNTANYPEWKKIIIPAERNSGDLHVKSYTIMGLKEKTIYEAILISRNKFGWSKSSSITIFATKDAEMNNEVKLELENRVEDNILPVEVATISTLTSHSTKISLSLYLNIVTCIFVLLFKSNFVQLSIIY